MCYRDYHGIRQEIEDPGFNPPQINYPPIRRAWIVTLSGEVWIVTGPKTPPDFS